MARTWQRRKFIINRKFQFTVIGYVGVLATAVIAVLYIADLYFFKTFIETGRSLGLPDDHVYYVFLNEQKIFMTKVFAVVALAIFALLAVGGILISHRIAGPIYHLCRHMLKVAEGQTIDEVQFRKRDFFPELADAYNRQLLYFRKETKIRNQGANDDAA